MVYKGKSHWNGWFRGTTWCKFISLCKLLRCFFVWLVVLLFPLLRIAFIMSKLHKIELRNSQHAPSFARPCVCVRGSEMRSYSIFSCSPGVFYAGIVNPIARYCKNTDIWNLAPCDQGWTPHGSFIPGDHGNFRWGSLPTVPPLHLVQGAMDLFGDINWTW